MITKQNKNYSIFFIGNHDNGILPSLCRYIYHKKILICFSYAKVGNLNYFVSNENKNKKRILSFAICFDDIIYMPLVISPVEEY